MQLFAHIVFSTGYQATVAKTWVYYKCITRTLYYVTDTVFSFVIDSKVNVG